MNKRTVKLAFLGLATAIALVLAYVEAILPPIYTAVPGIKFGLPNIIIVFILYRFGLKQAAVVSLIRILLMLLIFGNVMTFAYSVAGAVLSLAAMGMLKRLDFLSTIGVSVAGAVLHNVGQIRMAMLLLGTAEIGYYLIVLAVTGTLAGSVVGLCGNLMIRRIPEAMTK